MGFAIKDQIQIRKVSHRIKTNIKLAPAAASIDASTDNSVTRVSAQKYGSDDD
jgi:hypothetical protein